MKSLILSSIILSSFLVFLDQSKGWPEADKVAFMENCVSNASPTMGEAMAKDYCSCALDEVEKLYPNIEDALKITAQQMQTLAETCLAQIELEKEE